VSPWAWALIAVWAWYVVFALLNLWFPKPVKLWQRGRWALIFEPCDGWVGMYYDREDRELYVILVPTLPLRYSRP